MQVILIRRKPVDETAMMDQEIKNGIHRLFLPVQYSSTVQRLQDFQLPRSEQFQEEKVFYGMDLCIMRERSDQVLHQDHPRIYD